MNIWVITTGEPLPIDAGKERLLRSGLLCQMLTERDHQVTWWTSTYNHIKKFHRFPEDRSVQLNANFEIRLLYGRGYVRNVSVSRLVDHYLVARKFKNYAQHHKRPDVILCSYPTIELCFQAVKFGVRNNIPVVLDIRDLWPDIFFHLFPGALQPFAKGMLWPYIFLRNKVMKEASFILAINDGFIDWGIDYAGRDRTPFDQAFPMAYPATTLSDGEQARALAFWRDMGVTSSDEVFRVIFVGTIGRQFEWEPVIETAKVLRDKKVQFVICGAGDSFAHLKKLSQQVPTILLPGWVGAAEIWTLMRMAHVGLGPYHAEESFTHSLPNKSLEYLSAGLPIVASLPGALERLLDRNKCGLTYVNRNTKSLCSQLEVLLTNDSLRTTFAKNAKNLYETHFRADQIYPKMIASLERIAEIKR